MAFDNAGNLGKLVVEIGTNLDELSKGLKEATGKVEDFSKRGEVFAKNFSTAFVVAGTAVVGALGAAIFQTVKYSDELFTLSQRTGVSTEKLSRLKFVAEQTESSVEALASGFRILSKNVFEASNGNDALARKFQDLGVAIKGSDGQLRNVDDLFLDIADKVSALTNNTAKSALAIEFFGRNGVALLPVLNLGSKGIQELSAKAEKLGLVLTTENAKQIDQFADDLSALKASFTGISLTIGTTFIPILQKMVNFIQTGVIPIIENLNALFNRTGEILASEQIKGALGSSDPVLENARTQLVTTSGRRNELQGSLATSGGRGAEGIQQNINNLLVEEERLRNLIVERMNQQKDLIEEQKQAQQEIPPVIEVTEQLLTEAGIKQNESIDQFAVNLENFKQQVTQLNDDQIFELQTRLEQEQLLTQTAEQAKTQIIKDEIAVREAEAKKLGNQIIQFGNTIENSFSNALSGLISGTKSASEAARELGQSLVKAIADFIAQRLVAVTIGKAIAALEVALAKVTGGALAASYVEAATLASIATFGGAAVTGATAVAGALATTRGLVGATAGFAEGTDNIPARLSAGEMVVPRSFSDAIRQGRLTLGGPLGGNRNNQNGSVVFENINIEVTGNVDTDIIPNIIEQIGQTFENKIRGAV